MKRHTVNAALLATRGIITAAILVIIASCVRQPDHVGFAFYNVENLFDTIDDPDINDDSHLPGSRISWNTARYNTKLDRLARVMSSIDTVAGYPGIFGLCEVENLAVVSDLVDHPKLRSAEYQVIHHDSPDGRGIDCALLYQEDAFEPVVTRFITVDFPFSPDSRTRDILYTKGLVKGKDTLHIFINHWTSRWGGRAETEEKRRFIGQMLKHLSDSLFQMNPDACILIAGDLNDNPDDMSVATDLGALPVTGAIDRTSLYNLSLAAYQSGYGTLYYRSWDMFDQIIVSGNLVAGEHHLSVTQSGQEIVKHEWMLFQPADGPARPNRTSSREYYGGYSDHLPVFIRLSVR